MGVVSIIQQIKNSNSNLKAGRKFFFSRQNERVSVLKESIGQKPS